MDEKEATYLNLTPNYRIVRADDRNLELEEFRVVTAKKSRHVTEKYSSEKWVSLGYYGDLPQAVNGALKHAGSKFSKKQQIELTDAVAEIRGLSNDLINAVKESGITLTDFVKLPDNRGKSPKAVTVAKVKEVKADKTAPNKSRRSKKVTT